MTFFIFYLLVNMISRKYKRHHDFISNKKPRCYVYCDCNMTSWNIYNVWTGYVTNNILNDVLNHVYNHILGRYFSECSINIISLYIGNIYGNRFMFDSLTIGITFISDYPLMLNDPWLITKVITPTRCVVPHCGAPKSYSRICLEHYNQWIIIPTKYTHLHNCNECNVFITKQYKSIITKLNKKLYHVVVNHILSFCITTSFSKCRGHMLSRNYICRQCTTLKN